MHAATAGGLLALGLPEALQAASAAAQLTPGAWGSGLTSAVVTFPGTLVPASAADAASGLEVVLQEAHEAYRAGAFDRALALCQPVSSACSTPPSLSPP